MKVGDINRPAVWAATFVGVSINIEFDSVGNYYVVGNSTTVISDVNLNPDGSVVLPSGIGVYIIKYNSVGTALWCKKFACTSPSASRVLVDTSDNVYFLGNAVFGSAVDINGDGAITISSSGTKIAGYIVKYNSSGLGLWARTFITESFTIAVAELDKNNNIYIGGRYWVPTGQSNIDLGNSVTLPFNLNGNNTYLAKFNSSGVALVARNFGTAGFLFYSFGFDSSNNFYASGTYYLVSGQLNLNNSGTVFLPNTSEIILPSNVTYTTFDGFLGKFDTTDLQGLWSKQIKGRGSNSSTAVNGDAINKIVIDNNDNIYACGYYKAGSNIDLNEDGSVILPATQVGPATDMYLIKYNISGTALWAKTLAIKNSAADVARYMDLDSSNNIYVIGQINTTSASPAFTINGNTITTSGSDAIVLKYNPSGDIVEYKLIKGTGNDDGKSIVYDHYSNSYVVYGNYISSSAVVDLNGDSSIVLPIASTSSVFIIKFGQNTPSPVALPAVTNISDIISEYNASSVEVGETLKLAVRTNPANGVVTWDSSDTAFAIVDSYGIVTGITPGTVTITATYGTYTATKTVTVIPVRTLTSSTDTVPVNSTGTGDLTINLSNPEPNTIWYSSNPSVGYIYSFTDSSCVIRPMSAGTTVITAISGGKFYNKTITVTA